MKKESNEIRKEKYPSMRELKRTATQNGKAKTEFNFSEIFKAFYSAFMLRMVRIMIAIVKELTEELYRNVEKINAEIRHLKAAYEVVATQKAREMTGARQNVDRGGPNKYAWEARYVKARSEYESYRGDTKSKISQKISEAIFLKRNIEICADGEMTYCEELIALYWQIAKQYFNKPDACPPHFYDLMEIAKVSIPQVVIEDDRLSDVAEYLRNEAVTSMPTTAYNPGSFENPQLIAATGEPNTMKCPDCGTELPANGKFCSECGYKF
jgi:hypothetical protein